MPPQPLDNNTLLKLATKEWFSREELDDFAFPNNQSWWKLGWVAGYRAATRPAHACDDCYLTLTMCTSFRESLSKHDAAIRNAEREWWMIRVKATLQKTKYYDELETELQELVNEAMDESLRRGAP